MRMEAGIKKYHGANFLLALAMLPIVLIIVFEQDFSPFSFALLGVDAVCVIYHFLRWMLLPEKYRAALHASIILTGALPSLCLFSYSVMIHDWAAGLQQPMLILYPMIISFALFLREASFVYASMAVSVGGYLCLLGFAAFTGRLRLGAAYLGAWGKGYMDIAAPIFIAAILAIYGIVLGREVKAGDGDRPAEREKTPIGLSPREEEISRLIVQGLEHKEIAYTLNLSLSTVKNHVKKIYAKQGARNKVELINSLREKAGTPPGMQNSKARVPPATGSSMS